MSAMNFLLCFLVLVSGASPSKTFLVFSNMDLSCISLMIYFKHQAVSTLLCNSSLTNHVYLSIILRNFILYYLKSLYVGPNPPPSREICPDDYITFLRKRFIADCMKWHSIPWIVWEFNVIRTIQYHFRKAQRSICTGWNIYKQDIISKLKAIGQNLAIAGDFRHDSMGHSAKYCAYTLFCCIVPLIIDFSLIQVG
jgi:hypothetical protein